MFRIENRHLSHAWVKTEYCLETFFVVEIETIRTDFCLNRTAATSYLFQVNFCCI